MTLKEKIIKSGLKAAYISKESGISKAAISRIISGETYAPTKKTTEAIQYIINIASKQSNK